MNRLKLSVCLLALSLVSACSGFDGGLEPVGKLPDPRPADATSEVEVVAGALSFVRPMSGTSVDGDWIVIELALEGPSADGATTVVTATNAAGDVLGTSAFDGLTGVARAPAGAIILTAVTTVGGASYDASINVTASRVTPAIAFVTPLPASRYELQMPVPFEVALTDFTLLSTGAAPTGPRQGRLLVNVDDGAFPVLFDAKSGEWPALAAGEHTMTVTLVDASGAAWDPPVTASVAFAVDVPPAVSIVTPAEGATIEGARLTVTIAPERFVVDGAATAGHGTWLVRLDGTQVATRLTGNVAALSGLAAGPHTLEVELRTYDDRPLTTPVTASVAFETELLPPSLDIVLPTTSRTAEGTIKVAVLPHYFAFTNGQIPGPLVPATGGWQLLVDDVVVADKLTSAQTEVVVTPGSRELTARLVDNAGNQLVPPVEASRTIDVVEVQTSVEIISPRDDETVPKRFAVAVSFEDFKLSQNVLQPTDSAVPGQGHFHAFLRKEGTSSFVYQGFYLAETFELQADSPGRWDVLVALHYENHEPVMPAVEDVITVVVDDRPTVHIQTPLADATVGREPFAVSVAIDNFQLIPIGEVSNTKGHYHLFIDTIYQDFYLDPFAVIDPSRTLPSGLTSGPHRLEAFLHRSNHTPVDGSVGQVIDFIYDPTPRASLVWPVLQGARNTVDVTTEPFMVEIETDNLTLVDKIGEDAVPGEGQVHLFVDNVYVGIKTTPRFPVTLTTPGAHTIKLSLHNNDRTPIAGAESLFLDVLVDATPRVRITAPEDMGFVYGGDVDVVLAPDNLGAGDLVEVWLDGVVVYEGEPGVVTLPRLAEGGHELYTVPLSAEGAPLADGEVVTVMFEALALTPPTVSFVSPAANATLGDGATVTIGTSAFMLDGAAGAAPAVPGDGLWMLIVGEQRWGPYTSATIPLPALPRGPARLRAQLMHRDGSMTQAFAEVPVQIGGNAPRVALLGPAPGATVYGESYEVRAAVSDLELGAGKGWVSVRVDGRQQALWARPHGHIGPFATGQHILDIELLDGNRRPFTPPVTTRSQFRVGAAALPTLSMSAPREGQTFSAYVDVAFAVSNFELDPIGVRGRPQTGRGAVLVMVDGRVKAIATASPIRLSGLSPGRHMIEVQLVGLDLVPIAPATGTRAQVTIE